MEKNSEPVPRNFSVHFVVRNITKNEYYCGQGIFSNRLLMAEFHGDYDSAEKRINRLPNGIYQIEKVFSVRK